LAALYAPAVRLVVQEEECGPGEPYQPSDIDAFLDEETVSLRGPWRSNDLVEIGPSADDLGRGLYEYNLDFPGDALDPGCDYELWARRVTQGTEPTVYAHVATEAAYPDRLALQYWFYYPFNDWNNKHEGDWEMIQLVFEAGSVEEALAEEPLEVGYSQHEGAERADWGDDKLELVDGTHPVVYPAAGSHANFFDDALHIGRSAQQGVGCDDTSGPHVEERPVARTIPSDPVAAFEPYPWIIFDGRWGERQQAFFNGPTGPNLKTQWTMPITWSLDWRERSYAIPAGGTLGSDATSFFCNGVEWGSTLARKAANNPGAVVAGIAILLALLVFLATRTTWRPSTPLHVGHRRSWGRTLTASWRMYASRPRLFLGLGLVAIPAGVLVAFLQSGIVRAFGIGPELGGEGGGWEVAFAVYIGTVLALLTLTIVQAACARAIAEIDAGREVGVRHAYRLTLDSVKPLLGSLVVAVAIVTVLSLSFFLIPIAIWLVVRWALLAQAVELEKQTSLSALRRSGQLVRRQWLKVGTLVVVASLLALLAGPLLGVALLLGAADAPFELVNLISGIVYAVAMPFVGVTTTYVYYDTLVREQEDLASPPPEELPAEVSLG
jgi:hypothetical protein